MINQNVYQNGNCFFNSTVLSTVTVILKVLVSVPLLSFSKLERIYSVSFWFIKTEIVFLILLYLSIYNYMATQNCIIMYNIIFFFKHGLLRVYMYIHVCTVHCLVVQAHIQHVLLYGMCYYTACVTIRHVLLYRMCYYTACVTIPHVLLYSMCYYTAGCYSIAPWI